MAQVDRTSSTFDVFAIRCDGFDGACADHVSEVLEFVEEAVTDKKGLVILTPASLSATLLGAFVAGLRLAELRLRERKMEPASFLEDLDVGDIVFYRGRRGTFLGLEAFSRLDEPKIKIRFRDGLVLGIDTTQAWEISKCGNDVRRPDRYDTRRKHIQNDPRLVLAEILGRSETSLPPKLGVQVVVVTKKTNALNGFASLKYSDLPLASILPAAYYSGATSFERIGQDPLYREPVLQFFSNVDLALEVALTSNDNTALIIHDFDSVSGNINRVEELNRRGIPVIVPTEAHRLETAHLKFIERLQATGFRVRLSPDRRRRSDFKCSDFGGYGSDNEVLVSRKRVCYALAYESNTELVDDPRGKLLGHLRDRLLAHTRYGSKTEEFHQLQKILWRVVNTLARTPLSVSDARNLGFDYDDLFDQIRSRLPMLYQTLSEKEFVEVERLQRDLYEYVESHADSHPKEQVLLGSLERLEAPGCVLVGTPNERNLVTKWISEMGLDVPVLSASDLKRSARPFAGCVTTGWHRTAATVPFSGLIRRQTMIFYPYEKALYEFNAKAVVKRIGRLVNKDTMSETSASFGPIKFSDLMDDIADDWDKTDVTTSETTAGVEQAPGVAAISVFFEEGFGAFLTPYHRCRILDLDSETIYAKKTHDLNPGDILVFVKDSSNDIFDQLTSVLRADPRVKDIVEKSQLWKKALKRYIRQGNCTVSELQEQLRRLGVERSTAAIRRWLEPESIGAGEDAIRAIAKLTRERTLNLHLDEVVKACQRLRRLHRDLGRFLAHSIVSSMTEGRSVARAPLLSRLADDLSRHAELVTVSRIEKKRVTVPQSKVNRLLPIGAIEEIMN